MSGGCYGGGVWCLVFGFVWLVCLRVGGGMRRGGLGVEKGEFFLFWMG